MKRILFCVGLLVAGGALGVSQVGHAPLIGGAPGLVGEHQVQQEATQAERQTFIHANQARLRDLRLQVRQAGDDIDQLNILAGEAHQASVAAESQENVARFGDSAFRFFHDFGKLSERAQGMANDLQRHQPGSDRVPRRLDFEADESGLGLDGSQQPPMPPAGGLGEE